MVDSLMRTEEFCRTEVAATGREREAEVSSLGLEEGWRTPRTG